MNVARHLVRASAEHPDKAALVEPSGRTISFRELDQRTGEVAAALRNALPQAARVLFLVPISIELYIGLIALFRAGMTAVLVDPSAPRDKLAATFSRLDLKALVGSPKAHLLRVLMPELRGLDLYVSTGFTPLPHRRLRRLKAAPVPDVDPTAPALLTFTSGTTGRPRAIARSHAFLQEQHRVLVEHMGIGPTDVDLPTLPVFLLNSLAGGATAVLPDADLRNVGSVDPVRIVDQIRRHGVTCSTGSPAFYARISDYLVNSNQSLPGLKKLFIGGGRVPSSLLVSLTEHLPNAHIEVVYGSTEAEPIATIEASEVLALGGDDAGKGSCVGRIVDGLHLRLLGPGTLTAVEAGQVGEVVVAGDHVNPSYFEDPDSDALYKVVDGALTWHRTGDMARLDDHGRLWLVGREGDDVKGLWPLVVEGIADGFTGVQRSGLVEKDGLAVLAVQGTPDEDALKRLTGVDVVRVVDAIPVDPRHNAKVDRLLLRQKL